LRREREKVLSASRGEEMYTLGKLRHQIKSFSPLSEFRQDKVLLALSEFKQEKVLLAFERVQARESPSRL